MTTKPQSLNVEISAVCNYRCVSCPNTYMSRAKGFMDVELFEAIRAEVEPFLDTLYLWNYGEPLLHPRVAYLIESLRGSRIKTVMSSTGYMLEAFESLEFLTALDEVIISLNGLTQEVYKFHQQGGDFCQVLRGLRLLAPILQASSTHYVLQFVVNKSNIHQLSDVSIFAQVYGFKEIQIKTFNVMDDAVVTRQLFVPTETAYSRYVPTLAVIRPKSPCLNWMVINWDGDVNLCCWDYTSLYKIGNVRSDGVLAAWNSDILKIHRNSISNNRYKPICSRCAGPSIVHRSVV